MANDPTTDEQRLRADLLTTEVTTSPDESVEVEIQVLNTARVIEQVRVEVLGVEITAADSEPSTLTLFPDESARLTLRLRFPRQLPAGTHTALIQVVGQSTGAVAENELVVHVPAAPDLVVEVDPPLRRAGRRGRFNMTAANTGNTTLTLLVRATDADQRLKLQVDTPTVRLTPGERGTAGITARHGRPLRGEPLEHVLTVTAEQGDVTATGTARMVQKPVITAGIVTIFTLVLILGLWAVAMYFGVRAALATPPPTKSVPATWADGVGLADYDVIEVGGSVTGRVVAGTTAQPLPRVTVEAFDGDGVLITAAATDAEGVYTLGGLRPVDYTLRFRGTGIVESWWPDAPTRSSATALFVAPDATTPDIDAVVSGASATVSGRVIAGDDDPVDISVTVTPVDLVDSGEPTTVLAGPDGTWAVDGLVSPATYRVTAAADGYQSVEASTTLGPGETVVVNTVRLPASGGTIGGTVTGPDGTPVGGVEILVQRGDFSAGTVTPTAGVIGSYRVPDLPTPATYLVTFAGEGFSSETLAVRLGPGEANTGLDVALTPATGTVSGVVRAADGTLLGGAVVQIAGGDVAVETTTFTSGEIGGYRIGELPMPGIYTVTVSLEGYGAETLRVDVDPSAPTVVADVTLTENLGRVSGVVVDGAGTAVGAATVTLSDGAVSRQTTTASAPVAAIGRFSIEALEPGAYTVTVTRPTFSDRTVLVEVSEGAVSDLRVELEAAP